MKRVFIHMAVAIVLLIVGFAGGRLFQHAKTGFHFNVIAEKEYQSSMGPARWRYVRESIGIPFLDPGTTIIEYKGRTIYKAKRGFQESVPVAANVKVSGKHIAWDDGELQFHLTVEEMKKDDPDGASNGTQPTRSEASGTSSAAESRP